MIPLEGDTLTKGYVSMLYRSDGVTHTLPFSSTSHGRLSPAFCLEDVAVSLIVAQTNFIHWSMLETPWEGAPATGGEALVLANLHLDLRLGEANEGAV